MYMNTFILDNVQDFLEWSHALYHSIQQHKSDLGFNYDEDKLINY
jgi:hypothetical protein